MADFTPQEIEQFLQEFFDVVGTRQYVGARYVPIFGRKNESSIEWDNSAPYEPLTIVLHQGNSYTSRQYVPVGVDISNNAYWANTGNYNAQIEQYRRDTENVKNQVDATDALIPKSDFSPSNTVRDYVDANDRDRVLTFGTVSDMAGFEKFYDGAVCKTLGFHAIDDGGAGTYKISSSGSANGIDKISCGDYIAVLQYDSVVNIRALGAYGDDTHDDTSIITYAIGQEGVREISFGNGTYLVTSTLTLKSNLKLKGNAGKASKLSFRSTTVDFLNYGILLTNESNIVFEDIGFDGNESNFRYTTPNGTVFLVYSHPTADGSVSNIDFVGCYFTRSYDSSFNTYGTAGSDYPHYYTNNLRFVNCTFETIGVHGIGLNECAYVQIDDCYFHNVGLKLIVDSIGSGLAVDCSGGSHDVIVRGNLIDGAGGGFKAETHRKPDDTLQRAYNVIFADNVIKNLHNNENPTLYYGIKANGSNIMVVNNRIEALYIGVLVGVYAENCTLEGNTINGGTYTGGHGIRIDENYGGHIVANNIVHGANQQGIYSYASNCTIIGNHCYDCLATGIRIFKGSNIVIANNILHGNSVANLSIDPAADVYIDECVISGNLCYGSQRGLVLGTQRVTNCTFSNNQCYGNTTYNYSIALYLFPAINTQCKVTYTPNTPTNKAGEVGDICIKSNVGDTGVIGWICTAAGDPGTWRAFGA